MRLFPEKDPVQSFPEGNLIAETLLQLIKYKKLEKVCNGHIGKDPSCLIDALLGEIGINYDVADEDLDNIPAHGPFITVSNHPYRGIDSLMLFRIIAARRSDFRIGVNQILLNIGLFNEIIIPPAGPGENATTGSTFSGIRDAILHLKSGRCLGLFPAGARKEHYESSDIILDDEWLKPYLKFIMNSGVPVVPVYFHGTCSRLHFIIRKINPLLKAAGLPSEIRNRKRRRIKIRIGTPIPAKELSGFRDLGHMGRYLRARTYCLGSGIEPKKFFNGKMLRRHPEPVIPPIPSHLLKAEFEKARPSFELFAAGSFSVICAPVRVIPNIVYEIGRLRELTFREVGEGTGKSCDIDEYDLYYNHIFIWDTVAERIAGSYRIGCGKDILNQYGITGFYVASLFRIRKGFTPVLRESLELGRSFIVKDYQKKATPLFLLWKGIMAFLIRNQEYRYLLGPVSMSNEYSSFSKTLIVEFIRTYFFDHEKARYIMPRKKFVVRNDCAIDRKVFVDVADHDLNKIEKIIMDIEPGYRMPILLRRYLEINGRIIGFNVDPKFGDCLDGLLILDLYKVPAEMAMALSKELNEAPVMERFRP